MDIKKLTEAEDPKDKNDSIIDLDTYIHNLCNGGRNLEKLTDPQKNFYFNQELEKEVNNGGFNQYFFNSSGDYAHETLHSLRLIGANKTANILQRAIDQFPHKEVPLDIGERQEVIEQIEEGANVVWNELDKEFYAYEDDLNTLNLTYVKQHLNGFLE